MGLINSENGLAIETVSKEIFQEIKPNHKDLDCPLDELQKAKDFLWSYVNHHNKELIHFMMKENEKVGSTHLYNITLGYQYS